MFFVNVWISRVLFLFLENDLNGDDLSDDNNHYQCFNDDITYRYIIVDGSKIFIISGSEEVHHLESSLFVKVYLTTDKLFR